mmetsp:Transcript_30717/g.56699  ORF Transcript_30717/g.56699 Transcript_30717/m.56699 type:complete len:233 (-) Transcript_30717:170-868(-)
MMQAVIFISANIACLSQEQHVLNILPSVQELCNETEKVEEEQAVFVQRLVQSPAPAHSTPLPTAQGAAGDRVAAWYSKMKQLSLQSLRLNLHWHPEVLSLNLPPQVVKTLLLISEPLQILLLLVVLWCSPSHMFSALVCTQLVVHLFQVLAYFSCDSHPWCNFFALVFGFYYLLLAISSLVVRCKLRNEPDKIQVAGYFETVRESLFHLFCALYIIWYHICVMVTGKSPIFD